MGTGKSSVGAELASHLGFSFLDTDALIEGLVGCTIPQLFAAQGEAAFRDAEADALRRAVAGERRVIATGGGVMGRPENRTALLSNCFVVCLTASPEAILARVGAGEGRPMLAGASDPVERVGALLAQRAPLYALAHATVDTTGLMVAHIAERLAELWRQGQGADRTPR